MYMQDFHTTLPKGPDVWREYALFRIPRCRIGAAAQPRGLGGRQHFVPSIFD
jgi:hypothetical protein